MLAGRETRILGILWRNKREECEPRMFHKLPGILWSEGLIRLAPWDLRGKPRDAFVVPHSARKSSNAMRCQC